MSERSPDDAAVLNAWIARGDCNPSVAKEWLEQKEMEVARTERLPASESLTVGEMIDLVTVLDRMHNLIAVHPVIRLQYFRRDEVLGNSQGYQEFLGWKDIDFHRGTLAEAARELLARLVERFRKRSDELRQMPLLDAVRLLAQPENAANHIEGENRPSEATKSAANRRYTRGKLDEQAAIALTKNPSLTYKQLAAMLVCSPGTLRDKRKCPLLAAAKTRNKATKQEFYGKDKWTDRRPDDD